ncbi:unnamed protein product [Caenorhabditis nigoni]
MFMIDDGIRHISLHQNVSDHISNPLKRLLLLTLTAGAGFLEDKRQTIETLRGVCQHDEERIHNKTILQVLQHLETEIDSKEQSASFQHYLPHLMKSEQETTCRGSLAKDLYQLNLLTSSTSREANSANSTTSSLKIPDTYTIATPGKENDVTISDFVATTDWIIQRLEARLSKMEFWRRSEQAHHHDHSYYHFGAELLGFFFSLATRGW